MNPMVAMFAGLGFLLASAALYRLSAEVHKRPSRNFVIGVSAVGVLLALAVVRTEATGFLGSDLVLSAAVAGVLAMSATRARRSVLLAVSAVWALIALFSAARNLTEALLAGVFVGVPFGAIAASRVMPRRQRLVQATVAPLLGVAPFVLPTSLPSRVPSVAGVLGTVLIVVSAYQAARKPTRRVARRAFAGVVAVGGLLSVVGLLSVASARTSAERAIRSAQKGLSAAEALEGSTAQADLERAGVELRQARSSITRPWVYPAWTMPVLGRNLRAVDDLAESVSGLAAKASSVAAVADVEKLRPVNGAIDLVALQTVGSRISEFRKPLAEFRSVEAGVRKEPWVVPQLQDRLTNFVPQLDAIDKDLAIADEALRVVPNMLGAKGPRRYLVVIGNPAEARGSGGVIGNFGEITAVDGKLTLTRFGRNAELQTQGVPLYRRILDAPADFIARYAAFGAGSLWSNINMSPDFPSVGQAMAGHYPQSGGSKVDGVISVDPVALQAILSLTGPITVPGWPEPLDGTNTAEVLMYRAYVEKGGTTPERINLLAAVAQASWLKLTTASLPGPESLGASMGPIVKNHHLQMWMRDSAEQTYLGSIGASGKVPDGPGIVVNNASANKIEWFLNRTISTGPAITFEGVVAQPMTLKLRNDAPSSGLPDYVIGNKVSDVLVARGASRLYLSLYSDEEPLAILLNGERVPFQTDLEAGRRVSSIWSVVPSLGEVEVVFLMPESFVATRPWSLPVVRGDGSLR
jgi:hypothetical protein